VITKITSQVTFISIKNMEYDHGVYSYMVVYEMKCYTLHQLGLEELLPNI